MIGQHISHGYGKYASCIKLVSKENLNDSFRIFNVNLTIVTMKAPKHLLNATEVKPCRNGVKTYHIKMLNGLI